MGVVSGKDEDLWVCSACTDLSRSSDLTKLDPASAEVDGPGSVSAPAASRKAAKKMGAARAAAAAAERTEKMAHGELTDAQRALKERGEAVKAMIASKQGVQQSGKAQVKEDDSGSDVEAGVDHQDTAVTHQDTAIANQEQADLSGGESDEDAEPPDVMQLVVKHLAETTNADQALLIACAGGCQEAVKYCFDNGAVPSSSDESGFSAGYYASVSGSVEVLRALLEKDEHGEYSSTYFDSEVGPDGTTTFMTALRFGDSEMYQYMYDKLGCKLRLLGGEYGQTDHGHLIDKWLGFLPEITDMNMVAKMRPITLHNGRSNVGKRRSAQSLEHHRAIRLQVRKWVREKIQAQSQKASDKHDADDSPKGRGGRQRFALVPDASALAEQLEQRQSANGSAICAAPASAGMFEVVASVIPPGDSINLHARGDRTDQSGNVDETGMWMCGSCFAPHRMESSFTSSRALPCQQCKKVNFVAINKDEQIDEKDSDDDGEAWVNEGTEFASEKNIEHLMGPMKRSVLWSLGRNKARELMRIVRVVTRRAGDIIFIESENVKRVVLLTDGEVAMSDSNNTHEKVAVGSKGPTNILDEFGLMRSIKDGRKARHSWTAKVASKEATLYEFDETPIAEYMGYDPLGSLLHEANSRNLVSKLKVFKHILKENEQVAIARCLEYDIHRELSTIIAIGTSTAGLTIISQGKFRLKNPKRQKIVHAGNNYSVADDQKTGEKEKEQTIFAYVAGIRGLIFAVPSADQIESISRCELWRLSPEVIAHHYDSKFNLRNVLATSVYSDQLRSTIIFRDIPANDPALHALVNTCESCDYMEGDEVMKQGDKGDSVCLLVDGQVRVRLDERDVAKLTSDVDLNRVHHFGELSMISKQPRSASIIVASDMATVIWVTLADVSEHFGSLDQLLERQKRDALEAAQELKEGLGLNKEKDSEKVAKRASLQVFIPDKLGERRPMNPPTSGSKPPERHVPKAKAKAESKANAKAKAEPKGKSQTKAKTTAGGKIRASLSNVQSIFKGGK